MATIDSRLSKLESVARTQAVAERSRAMDDLIDWLASCDEGPTLDAWSHWVFSTMPDDVTPADWQIINASVERMPGELQAEVRETYERLAALGVDGYVPGRSPL